MMRIDSHMHVWSFEGVEYYDNKPLFTYMEELKLDRTALIAINLSLIHISHSSGG